MSDFEFDVFISHASEDKNEVARPLAEHLIAMGYRVWFDEFELKVGDSLSEKIDHGLANARTGIVVLSHHFFQKKWPPRELAGLTSVEMARGGRILPVWHNIKHDEVARHSPVLADRLAAVTSLGLEGMCQKLAASIGAPSGPVQPLKQGRHSAGDRESTNSGEMVLDPAAQAALETRQVCPKCGQTGRIYGFDGSDGDEFDWFECSSCGYFHTLHSIPGR